MIGRNVRSIAPFGIMLVSNSNKVTFARKNNISGVAKIKIVCVDVYKVIDSRDARINDCLDNIPPLPLC